MQRLRVSHAVFGILVSLILLVGSHAAAEQRWAFAGFYELGEVTDLGEEVQVPLTVRVFNYSDADVTGATITLEDWLLPGETYGSFPGTVDIRVGESRRLSDSFTVPWSLYEEWWEGSPPQLRIEFKDADGNIARGPIALLELPVGGEG